MKQPALVLCLLALAACAPLPAAPPPLSPGPVAIGQAAIFPGVSVRSLALLEDSRCPAQVQCVWAGRIRILAEIAHRGGSEELRREMVLGEPVAFPDGVLTLVAAAPEPIAGQAIDPRYYRLTFTFTTR